MKKKEEQLETLRIENTKLKMKMQTMKDKLDNPVRNEAVRGHSGG